MDRDPLANAIDPVERVSPASGQSDTGESGERRAREEKRRSNNAGSDQQDLDDRRTSNKGVN